MNLDLSEIKEQIVHFSLGVTIPKIERSLGLYISPEALFLSEAHLGDGGKPAVDHVVRVPVPPNLKAPAQGAKAGALNAEFLARVDDLAKILEESLAKIAWSTKFVTVTLSHHFGILRYFAMPSVERRFWAMSVPLEAKRYIPIPFDELSYDFQVFPPSTGFDKKGRQVVLFGVTPLQNVENIKLLVTRLGLQLAGLELSHCSVARVLSQVDPGSASGPTARVHFDDKVVHILVTNHGLPILTREITLATPSPQMESRKLDMKGCVDFCRNQLGMGEAPRLTLSGSTQEMESWKAVLSQETGLAAEHQELSKLVAVKGSEWGGVGSLGASLRAQAPGVLQVDLCKVGRVPQEEKDAVLTLLKASGAAALFFVALGFMNQVRIFYYDRELSSLRRTVAVLPAFQGKKPEEIEKMIAQMRTGSSTFAHLSGSRLGATGVLTVLAEQTPDRVWLKSLNYQSPLLASGDSGSVLDLSGHTSAENQPKELEISTQFKENLVKEKERGFSRVFRECIPSFQTRAEDLAAPKEDEKKGSQGELLRQMRTTFRISCRSKR